MSLFTKLFAGRRNRTVRRPAPQNRSARLGFDTLGDRIMPAVAVSLSNGVLSVIGDYRNDSATASQGSHVVINDWTTGGAYGFPASSVSSIRFVGNDGDDGFHNSTSKPATFEGGNGNDWLKGGSSTDTFYGSPGTDVYIGEGGQDVLYRNGYRGYFEDGYRTGDNDLTVGQVAYNGTNRLSANELRAQGHIVASLDTADPTRLILNGPSGAAVVLKSNWEKKPGDDLIQTVQNVSMETPDGDVLVMPRVPGVKTRVFVDDWTVAEGGKYAGITWANVPVTNGTNPLNAAIDNALAGTNVNIDLPTVNWGIALGSSITGSLDGDATVNNAVPYLYGAFNTGFTLGIPNVSASTPNATSGVVAYAPSDGTFYAGLGDYGVAVSEYGYIPYTPNQVPSGLSDPNIFGHYHARGTIQVNSFSITGSAVLDLDANDNGSSALLNATTITSRLSSFAQGLADGSSINELGVLATSVMNDTAVGLNGSVSLGLKDIVEINLGDASAWYKPGQIAFKAQTANPFEGLGALERLGNTTFTVQGYTQWSSGATRPSYWLRADASSASFGNLPVGNLYLQATNTSANAFSVGGTVAIHNVAYISVSGTIGFDGGVSLIGGYETYRREDVNWLDLHASTTFTMWVWIGYSNNTFTVGGSVSGSAGVKQDQIGEASISFSATMNVSVSSSGVWLSGSGSITGSIWEYTGNNHWSATVSFSFTNQSLTIYAPLVDDITISW